MTTKLVYVSRRPVAYKQPEMPSSADELAFRQLMLRQLDKESSEAIELLRRNSKAMVDRMDIWDHGLVYLVPRLERKKWSNSYLGWDGGTSASQKI